ncbi:hypothetical protein NPIL_421551 [Nephila pilipes]|uniref:Uncharacterized protein n=1 Tax=Nephila pilipes TaxID=299642 RepID=A0A8X6U606_NEPPI|nr:hypothetical protein NPIL_421551 [Nephila pilipes]
MGTHLVACYYDQWKDAMQRDWATCNRPPLSNMHAEINTGINHPVAAESSGQHARSKAGKQYDMRPLGGGV